MLSICSSHIKHLQQLQFREFTDTALQKKQKHSDERNNIQPYTAIYKNKNN